MKNILILFLTLFSTQILTAQEKLPETIRLSIDTSFDGKIRVGMFYNRRDSKYYAYSSIEKDDAKPIKKTLVISKEQYFKIAKSFNKVDFLKIFKSYPSMGLDGSTWKFSATQDGFGANFSFSYWSPVGEKHTQPLVKLAKNMLSVAGVKLTDKDIY